ncbi:MAG TPA: nucleotidyltransferase [Gemmatimonadales bacterium]|nr:nucleotidyltransferase [Gemmatimonadales bacterium]
MKPAADVAPDWQMRIPDSEWAVYSRVIREIRLAGIRFAFGGAFATAVYTHQLRNTKDFDFYILPADRERMEQALTRAGLHDHFERLSYDRNWIYRASQDDVIVDAIWQMANYRAQVDEQWLARGPEIVIRGEALRAIPIEELIWSKLYVLQRERCDWTDVFKLIDAQTASIDWDHLLDRLADDAPLLAGALEVYSWLAPDRAGRIEQRVWERLRLPYPTLITNSELSRARADLLDSRPWFRTPE